MPFVAPGSGSSTKSNTIAPKFVAPTQHYAPTPGTSLLSTKAQLQANAKQKQQQQNNGAVHKTLNAVDSFFGGAAHVGESVGKTVAQPFEDVGKQVGKQAKYLSDPDQTEQGKPGTNQIIKNQQAAAKNPEYLKAINDPSVKGKNGSVQGVTQAQQMAASGAKAPQIVSHLQKDAAAVSAQNKKAVGDAIQIGSDFVGGGEAKGAIKSVETVADLSKAAKVAKNVKAVLPVATAAGASGGGSVVASNPNASPGQIAEGVGEGVGTGLLGVGASKAGGKALKMIFGKAPDAIEPKTPTPIEVTDKSTGTTKGIVSSTLPRSTGAGKIPVTVSGRPSAAGYNDIEFRQIFNGPAKEVAKNTPEVADAFQKTGSKDPTTLAVQALTDSTTGAKRSGIIKTLLPGLSKDDHETLVSGIAATKDPQETAHLLFDAAKNHEAQQNAGALLTGTPLDKKISFDNPSDAENAQRATLHTRVDQINKAIDNHAAGTKEQTPEALNALLKSRQTAQDVLDGKTKYEDAYSPTAAPAAVKPLPFVGDAVEPREPTTKGGIVDRLPAVGQGDATRQAVVNREVAMRNTLDTFHAAETTNTWDKLSKEDQQLFEKSEQSPTISEKDGMNAMIRIAKSKAQNPENFIKYAQLHVADMKTVLAHRQALHPDTGELPNYRPHIYDRGDKATNDFLNARQEQYALAIKNGKPGYTQHRVIPTYAEAAKVLDSKGQPLLKRANANAHEDYIQALQQTAAENGQAALVKGLKEAHGNGAVFHVGVSPQGDNLGNLKISGGRGLSMNDDLAAHYNSRAAATPSRNAFVRGYDKVNKGVKNTILAGGAFHGLQSGLTVAGQQLISGIRHPSYLVHNLRLVADTLSPRLREAHLEAMRNNGADFKDGMSSLQRQRASGLTYTDLATKATDGKSQGLLNKLPGFKQLHSAVFERQLPAAKQMLFDQKTAHLDLRNPTDLAKARNEAAGINYMVGGVDSATQGLSPKAIQKFGRVVLAADYTQGRAMTVANAITKWGADNPAGRTARQAVVGKSLVTALPGLVALAATGKLNLNDPKAVGDAFIAQIIEPQIPTNLRTSPTQSNAKGNPISLKLPSTYISEIGKILAPAIKPGETYDNSRTSGLKDFASSRLAALPATAEKLLVNKDFYGNPIITGGPKKTGQNIAEQFAPIPVAQGAKTTSGSQSFPEALLNEAGLRASASTLSGANAHTQRLNEFYNTNKALYTARQRVVAQMNDLVRQKQPQRAVRMAQEFNDSINQRTLNFRTKYINNYNPQFDKDFLANKISSTPNALKARTKALQATDALYK